MTPSHRAIEATLALRRYVRIRRDKGVEPDWHTLNQRLNRYYPGLKPADLQYVADHYEPGDRK